MTTTRKHPLWDRVENFGGEGCWLWTGALSTDGYGTVHYPYNGRCTWRAHRLAYTIAKADIPDGLDLDHLCRVRHCVNPDHLEPVTRAENTRRQWDRPDRYKPWQVPGRNTPPRSFRPPPELWEKAKTTAAANGETVTDVLNRALEDYVKGKGKKR